MGCGLYEKTFLARSHGPDERGEKREPDSNEPLAIEIQHNQFNPE